MANSSRRKKRLSWKVSEARITGNVRGGAACAFSCCRRPARTEAAGPSRRLGIALLGHTDTAPRAVSQTSP